MDGGSSAFVLSQLAESLAVMLCDVAVKGVVVLVLAMVLTATMRRASAAARHLVWLLAVLSLLALPVLSVCLPAWHVLPRWSGLRTEAVGSVRRAPAAEEIPNVAERAADAPYVALGDVGAMGLRRTTNIETHLPETPSPEILAGTRSSGARDGWSVVSVAAWVVIVWVVGAVAALSPIVIGTLSLWRLQFVARSLTGRVWTDLLDRASAGLGLRRQVALLCSDDRSVPMAWGMLRPKVLLPGVAERWAEGRRWVVLLHELAHVKRWDCVSHIVTRLACALHWFNPLVWLATRRLLSESERACDDLVLRAGSNGPDYAQHLLEVASGLETKSLAAYTSIAMARPSKLEGRLIAILDPRRNRRALTRLALIVGLGLAVVAVLPLASLRSQAQGQEAGKNPQEPTQTNAHRSRIDIEKRLYREIADMLQRGGNRFDGLVVTVSPDLTAAKCTISGLRELRGVDGRNVIVPIDGGFRIEYTGRGIWAVRGSGHLGHLRFEVNTEELMRRAPSPTAANEDSSQGVAKTDMRKRKSVLFTQGWRALREERFGDAYEIADQILQLDPQDQPAKILRDRAFQEKHVRKLSKIRERFGAELKRRTHDESGKQKEPRVDDFVTYPGKEVWEDVIARRRKIASDPGAGKESFEVLRIREKLKDKISLDFADTPITDVVPFLQHVSGIKMKLDPDATGEDGPLITLKVEDMPLENALDVMLRRLAKLDYVISDNGIFISTKGGLAEYEVRTYDVHDLLMAKADGQLGDVAERRGLAIDLVTLITTIVKPGTWQHAWVSINGELATIGAGKDAGGVIVCRDDELIVKQTIAIHVEVAKLINSLRESRAAKAGRHARPAELDHERQREMDVQLRRRKSVLFAQGWKALRAGRFDDARLIASQILDLDPEDESARILIARVKQEEALDRSRKAAGDGHGEAKQAETGRKTEKDIGIRRQLPIVVPGGEDVESPQVRRTREKLRTKVSLDVAATPIVDVIAYLHDASGVNMMLDPDAIRGQQPTITLRLADISLRAALDIVVRRMAKLDYAVRADGIFISNAEGLSKYELRTYDVRDILLKFCPRADDDQGRRDAAEARRIQGACEMLRLIHTTVAPESWQYAFVSGLGGADDIQIKLAGDRDGARGGLAYREGDLIVWQTPKVHLEVSKLLRSIRSAIDYGVSLQCSRISLSAEKAEALSATMADAASLYRGVHVEGHVAALSSRDCRTLISDQNVAAEVLPRRGLSDGMATLMPLGSGIPFALFVKPSITTDRKSVVIEWALAPPLEGKGAVGESVAADHRDLLARAVVSDRRALLILWNRLPGGVKPPQQRLGVLVVPTVVIQDEEEDKADR